MTDEIRPALTREEWAALLHPSDKAWKAISDAEEVAFDRGDDHALAALALYRLVVDGKPVGFTREILARLTEAVRAWRRWAEGENILQHPDAAERLRQMELGLANIAALLPPEAS
jgi:hypothetical protein